MYEIHCWKVRSETTDVFFLFWRLKMTVVYRFSFVRSPEGVLWFDLMSDINSFEEEFSLRQVTFGNRGGRLVDESVQIN